MGAIVEAWHLGNVSVELLYMMYKLTYVDVLRLLKYIGDIVLFLHIGDIVLFLLSCVDGKRGEQVKHDVVVK